MYETHTDETNRMDYEFNSRVTDVDRMVSEGQLTQSQGDTVIAKLTRKYLEGCREIIAIAKHTIKEMAKIARGGGGEGEGGGGEGGGE